MALQGETPAEQRDPVRAFEGHEHEPLSSPPVTSRDPGTIASVAAPASPAARKWSWPELMRHTFEVGVLACARCGGSGEGMNQQTSRRHFGTRKANAQPQTGRLLPGGRAADRSPNNGCLPQH